MKHGILIAVFISSFLGAMQVPLLDIPQAISSYQPLLSWAEYDMRDRQVDEVIAQRPYLTALLKRENGGNLNANFYNKETDYNHLFGSSSLLFNAAFDDGLVNISIELMNEGANPNFATDTGHTPFEQALRTNAVQTAWHMLQRGGDAAYGLRVLTDHVCYTVNSSLFNAQKALMAAMLEKLRAQRCSVDMPDVFGRTPLMNLMQIKYHIPIRVDFRKELAALLLGQGANINLRDEDGKSALHMVQKNRFIEVVSLFCK